MGACSSQDNQPDKKTMEPDKITMESKKTTEHGHDRLADNTGEYGYVGQNLCRRVFDPDVNDYVYIPEESAMMDEAFVNGQATEAEQHFE